MAERLRVEALPDGLMGRWMACLVQPGRRPPWEALSREAQAGLRAAYFLLDVEPGKDAESLVLHVFPRLERQLQHRTERTLVECRDRLRGSISWPATHRARAGAQGAPTLMVCRETQHRYDTPENQLLRLMVDRLEQCLKAVPATLADGTCWDGQAAPQSVRYRLERLRAELARFRGNPRLRQVSLPRRVSEVQLQRAEASRMREYAEVRRLYARYESLVLSPDPWAELVSTSRRVLLLPGPAPDQEEWLRIAAALVRG